LIWLKLIEVKNMKKTNILYMGLALILVLMFLAPSALAATGEVIWLNPPENKGKIRRGDEDDNGEYEYNTNADKTNPPDWEPSIGDRVTFTEGPGNKSTDVTLDPDDPRTDTEIVEFILDWKFELKEKKIPSNVFGIEPIPDIDKPFLMPIEDVFTISGRGTVVTGRVERGVVNTGDEVEIIGLDLDPKTTNADSVVTGVDMFTKILDEGMAGDNVGVLLRGVDKDEVQRGQVLAKPGSITPHKEFKAEVYILTKEEGGRHTPFFIGYRPQFYFRTTDVTGESTLPSGKEMVMPGDNINMEVELITPIAIDEGLQFAIREGGKTVGAGVITEIRDSERDSVHLQLEFSMDISIDGIGTGVIHAEGPATVENTEADPATGVFDTEIVSMNLVGSIEIGPIIEPVEIKAGRDFGLPPSTGSVTPITPGTDFPATSFFDVFVEIEVGGLLLINEDPFRVETTISEYPPIGSTFTSPTPPPLIPLIDPTGLSSGEILRGSFTVK
jgi:hypothetical protein